VVKDLVQAAYWYRKSAEKGDAQAQNDLGLCYARGDGVEKDEAQAVLWYRIAAEQGNSEAQINLGFSYESGVGVAKDEIEAYAFLNLAGITDEAARKKLAILEKKLSQDGRLLGQRRTKELKDEIEAKIAAKRTSR
jgi:TPR repeat protein